MSYAITFKDLHNFWLPSEKYLALFNEDFLNFKLPLDHFDINNVMGEKTQLRFMNFSDRLKARERAEAWNSKYYPETLKKNVQIFDDYLSLCIKNNVRPIVFMTPVSKCYSKYFSEKILSEFLHFVDETIKKYPDAGFVNGWNIKGFDDSDFYDVDHMNIKGAAKFSEILNNVIELIEKL